MIRVTRYQEGQIARELESAYHYRIAGQAMVFQNQVASLAAYEQEPASEQFNQLFKAPPAMQILNRSNARLQYSGMAPLNRIDRKVDYWRRSGYAQIDVDGVPVCHLDHHENHIHVLNQASFDDRINLEVVTGPAIITMLALKNIYCLHAGAAATPAGNLAFIAESGSGKSTLSAHVSQHWSQISDDILPLSLSPSEDFVEMMSDFPQLKLDGGRVVDANRSGYALHFLLRINPQESKTIQFTRLGGTDALLQVIRHTVGAKLFDKRQMKIHSIFAKKISALIPVIEVSYPRNLAQLSELREGIVDYLSGVS